MTRVPGTAYTPQIAQWYNERFTPHGLARPVIGTETPMASAKVSPNVTMQTPFPSSLPQPMQRPQQFGGGYGMGFPFRFSGMTSRMRSSLPNPMTGAMGPPPSMPLPGWKPPKTLF